MRIDKAAAYHEAGHSVIARLTPVDNAEELQPGTPQYKEMVWSMMVSFMAGGIAEERATGDFLQSASRVDAEKAFVLASTLAMWGGSPEELMVRAADRAEELITQHWGKVQDLAAEFQSRDWNPIHVVVHMCPRGRA